MTAPAQPSSSEASTEPMKVKNGIRKRFTFAMLGMVGVVSILLTLFQLSSETKLLHSQLEKRVALKQENLQRRAISLVTQLRHQAENELASYNLFHLSSELRRMVGNHPDVEFIMMVSQQGTVIIHTADARQQQKPYNIEKSNQVQTVLKGHFLLNSTADEIIADTVVKPETQWLDYQVPVSLGNVDWGFMVVRFSLKSLNDEILKTHQDIDQNIELITYKTLSIVALVLFIAYLVTAKLSQRLSAPLMLLTKQAKQIANGDFSIEAVASRSREDEVGVLTANFLEMARKLQASYAELEGYNERLEEEVANRTKELEESQQQLVHSEKMAALGLLVASIAHELNTPMGAVQASSENAEHGYQAFLNDLDKLASLSEQNKAFLVLLLKEARVLPNRTTREGRKVRKHIEADLATKGVPWGDELAPVLAEMGLEHALDKLLPYLDSRDVLAVVQSAYQLFSIQASLATINIATARASKVVFALKYFAHKDSSGEKVPADINEGLRTVLELYRGLFKQGCEVVQELGDLAPLNCYPDELNQVWTNLIHNALQAMNNEGKLELVSYLENSPHGTDIVVTVTDSGPGIPDHLKEKIWDSFFTTKIAGEGSGLGLGICKRIIEKHHGQISFDSRPGRTQFKVKLPVEDI